MRVPIDNFSKLFATNNATASFPSLIPTLAEPNGEGVFNVGVIGNWLSFIPYGAGADNATCKIKATGWRRVGNAGTLWIPSTLLIVTCTLSTAVGIAGQDIVDTDRLADTLTKDFGSVNAEVLSPADNTPGLVWFETLGFEKIQLTTDRNASATSVNALVAPC